MYYFSLTYGAHQHNMRKTPFWHSRRKTSTFKWKFHRIHSWQKTTEK